MTIRRSRLIDQAMVELAFFFHRNGCVRRQNAQRLVREGYLAYKKGDEVRLSARTSEELEQIRGLLRRAGFAPGKPFVKRQGYQQPIYGRLQVRRFLETIAAAKTPRFSAQPNRHRAGRRTMSGGKKSRSAN